MACAPSPSTRRGRRGGRSRHLRICVEGSQGGFLGEIQDGDSGSGLGPQTAEDTSVVGGLVCGWDDMLVVKGLWEQLGLMELQSPSREVEGQSPAIVVTVGVQRMMTCMGPCWMGGRGLDRVL